VSDNWKPVLRRQLPLAVVIFLLGSILTVSVILLAPRAYQSQAKLLFKLGHESVTLDPTVASSGTPSTIVRTNENEMATALELMKSEAVLEEVIERVGVSAILSGRLGTSQTPPTLLRKLQQFVGSMIAQIDPIEDSERAIMKLQDSLRLDTQTGANVVNVSYRTKSPELAQLVTEEWLSVFRQLHKEMIATNGSLGFFKSEETVLEDQLVAARDQLRQRKSSFNIVTVPGRQANLENQLQWAENALIQAKADLAAANAKLRSLSDRELLTPNRIVSSEAQRDTNETAAGMRNQLYELELEERRLAATYTKDHPKYRAVANQLDGARQLLSSQVNQSREVTEDLNPLYLNLLDQMTTIEGEQSALQSKTEATEDIVDELRTELHELNSQEAELASLQRHVDVLESQYRLHHERGEQARLADKLRESSINNLNVIQEPTLRRRPVSPNKKLCAILGFLGSCACAFGVAMFRESQFQARLEREFYRKRTGLNGCTTYPTDSSSRVTPGDLFDPEESFSTSESSTPSLSKPDNASLPR